jgi:hypothetical protein
MVIFTDNVSLHPINDNILTILYMNVQISPLINIMEI